MPGAAIVAVDFAVRHARLASYREDVRGFYWLTCALSIVLWGALTALAARRSGALRWAARAALIAGAVIAVGGQLYLRARYGAYLNYRAATVGMSMLPSVGQQLWSDRASLLLMVAAPALFALTWPIMLARKAPTSPAFERIASDVAAAALALSIFWAVPRAADQQGATPDILYLSAMGELAAARWEHARDAERTTPGRRSPRAVPPLARDPQRPTPNVVFIVTESVRASDTCLLPDHGECASTPYTNALLPERFAFTQMRAVSSTTAISLAVMWSGLPPEASRKDFHEMPLLWEYANAAGVDSAYWTSQNLFFANAGVWLDGIPASKRVSATQLVDYSTYEIGADDGLLVDHVLAHVGELRAPYVAVVHFSNTHAPYLIDPADAPFQPQVLGFGPGPIEPIHNRYRDAIRRQDRIVARLVRELRSNPERAPVVMFTSDHGEQMRERGALTHTTSLIDAEIRVPFWIDAPVGALAPAQVDALRAQRDRPRTHLDVLPTLLDLGGVWDAPALAPLRAKLPGQSLLRGGSSEDRAVGLSNCSELFSCAFRNWGAIRGTKKLIASEKDTRWQCYDVARDPDEATDLGEAACVELRDAAEAGRGAPF